MHVPSWQNFKHSTAVEIGLSHLQPFMNSHFPFLMPVESALPNISSGAQTDVLSHGTPTTSARLHLKCDGTHTKTRFRLSAKQTGPFKSAGA